MATNEDAPHWLSLQEAARRCDVTPRTVRGWISEGRLKGYRAGPRLVRVKTEELDALFSEIPTFDREGA